MRRFAVLCAAIALAGCGASTAGSAGATGGTTGSTDSPGTGSGAVACGKTSARTLAGNRRVRVFITNAQVLGCARHGRTIRLGSSRTCMRAHLIGPVRVAGNLVAYGAEECGVDTGSTTVTLRRLTDGRRLDSRPAVTGPARPESYTKIGSMALRADGSVAWIATSHSLAGGGGESEVHRLQHGRFTLLDSSQAIDIHSLTLHGSTLSWRHGSATRTASLS